MFVEPRLSGGIFTSLLMCKYFLNSQRRLSLLFSLTKTVACNMNNTHSAITCPVSRTVHLLRDFSAQGGGNLQTYETNYHSRFVRLP